MKIRTQKQFLAKGDVYRIRYNMSFRKRLKMVKNGDYGSIQYCFEYYVENELTECKTLRQFIKTHRDLIESWIFEC